MSAVVDPSGISGIELQSELSRINLLRIRGDISSAKTLCLSTLKKYPTSVDAHVLMGDMHAEQADLGPAAEWYALALDLDPNAPGVPVKLNKIRAALDISKQATVQKALISSGRKVSPWLIAGVAVAILAIGSLAFIAGSQKTTSPQISSKSPVERLTIPRDFQPAPSNTPRPDINFATNSLPLGTVANSAVTRPAEYSSAEPKKEATGQIGVVAQDQTLLEAIRERTKFSKNIISIQDDPRTSAMTITYLVSAEEHGRYTGAMVALTALDYHKKANSVTLRGVRNGILTYMADVQRDKVVAQETERGSLQDLADHGWIDSVLKNEYYLSKELTGVNPK